MNTGRSASKQAQENSSKDGQKSYPTHTLKNLHTTGRILTKGKKGASGHTAIQMMFGLKDSEI